MSENPDQHVHIPEPHGLNIGGARQPPACTNSQHSHDTAEVFVVHTGRWRFDFHGEANHAGTTRLDDRHDPMLTYATTVLAARKKARQAGALATFGKVSVEPNGVNAIASLVRGWLDSRAADEETLAAVVGEIERAAVERELEEIRAQLDWVRDYL